MENNGIKIYAIYDKVLDIYAGIIMGFDDQETCKYVFETFSNMFASLMSYYKGDELENEKQKLIEKIKNSSIMKLADFNNKSGEFNNEKVVLLDLFDYDLDDFINKKIKKESD